MQNYTKYHKIVTFAISILAKLSMLPRRGMPRLYRQSSFTPLYLIHLIHPFYPIYPIL